MAVGNSTIVVECLVVWCGVALSNLGSISG